jgi:hypothetical protein
VVFAPHIFNRHKTEKTEMAPSEIGKQKIQRTESTALIETVKIWTGSEQLPPAYLILSDQTIFFVDQSQDLENFHSGENDKILYQFMLKKIKICPMMSPKVFTIDDTRHKIEVSCDSVTLARKILKTIEVSH